MGVLQDLLDRDENEPQGYLELMLDNVVGLDNNRTSVGEALGQKINEDELQFLKDTGMGIYEGAKEFVQNPIETTKEVVTDVATSVKDLFTKNEEERLQEMFGVDSSEATPEQINQMREGRFGDFLNTASLVPVAGGAFKAGKSLASVLPELEINPNTVGMNLGNIKFKKEKLDDADLNDENIDSLTEELMSVAAYQAANMGKNGSPPINSIKGYKLFRINRETGELFPLYVDAKTAIPINEWVPAIAGDLTKSGKVKSEIGELAYRPGFHAAQLPWVNHIGSKFEITKEKFDELKADGANNLIQENTKSGTKYYERLRDEDTVWAEVEMPNDVDWQSEANAKARIKKDGTPEAKTAHITDQIPVGGTYLYNTKAGNPNQWLIGGSMKINRVLDDAEVEKINMDAGVLGSDMPRKPYSQNNKVPASVAKQTDEMLNTSKVVPGGNPEFGPTGRISTRMPLQAPVKDEIPTEEFYSGELIIDRNVMDEAGTTEKNMEYLASNREQSDDVVKSKGKERPLFTSTTPNPYEDIGDVPYFPGFKALEGMSTEDRVKFVSAMQKENLEWVMTKLPKGFQDRAKLWYTGANRFSEELASKYGVPRQSMSGVLAALSPQKDWFQNASLAERVADAAINNRNFPWSSEMSAVVNKYPTFKTGGRGKNAAIWESIQGKKYSELETTKQKAMWIRAYDEAHNPKTYRALTPEGDLGDIILSGNSPKDIAWGGFNPIEKAVDALESGGDFKVLSDAMGGQHKVRNFFNNIEVPFSDMGDVTIDTHAIAAALMRPLGGDDRLVAQGLGAIGGQNKYLGAKGNYGFIADDYRDVADNRGLLPREVQSITWEGIRSLFNNKSDAVKRKVNTIWSQVDKGNLTQQQALDLIESELGGFGATNQVLTPRTNRSISAGGSTMFAAGGLALLDEAEEEEGFASPK